MGRKMEHAREQRNLFILSLLIPLIKGVLSVAVTMHEFMKYGGLGAEAYFPHLAGGGGGSSSPLSPPPPPTVIIPAL